MITRTQPGTTANLSILAAISDAASPDVRAAVSLPATWTADMMIRAHSMGNWQLLVGALNTLYKRGFEGDGYHNPYWLMSAFVSPGVPDIEPGTPMLRFVTGLPPVQVADITDELLTRVLSGARPAIGPEGPITSDEEIDRITAAYRRLCASPALGIRVLLVPPDAMLDLLSQVDDLGKWPPGWLKAELVKRGMPKDSSD